ncbi:MAG: EamA family transporter [Lachnospiraceae bacterium]|nr:EamA family transporter [Lachnospiraceae bacterium]
MEANHEITKKSSGSVRLALLMTLMAGIGWGCIGLFVRRLNVLSFSSFEICAIRNSITLCLLFILILCTDRSLFKIRLKDIWCFLGTGIVSLILFNVCYFTTITLTSLSIAAVLLYTSPAFVMIMSRFIFGEKITGRKVLAIVLTIGGCFLVSGMIGDTGSLTLKGLLMGLCSGFCYALYSIFGRFALNKGYNSMTISFYTFVFGTIGLIPLVNYPAIGQVILSSASNIILAILFALICTLMPYLFYTKGLTILENSTAAVVVAIEPVVATLISVLILHEPMTLLEGAGIIMVLIAIVLA